MAQVIEGYSHGLYKIVAQLTGADGSSYGVAGDGISAGANSNAYVMDWPQSANIAIPDRTTIDFTGGDRWQQSYQYGITSLGSFDFSLENTDPTMTALCTGTLVDQTTNAAWTQYTEDILAGARPQLSLMIIHKIQSAEQSTFGQTKYVNTIIPRCWIAPKGVSGINFQAKAASTFQVTATGAARAIDGEAFAANLNAADNRVAWYHIISDYPLAMVAAKANATSHNIVGAYKPISSVVGTTSSSKNRIVKLSGTTYTVGVADTVTTATATAAVGTALTVAANDFLFWLYETGYVAA